MRKILILASVAGLVGSVSLAGQAAAAQPALVGPQDGFLRLVGKHAHIHKNGHALLGEKRNQDGRHEVDRIKGHHVTAEVKHGKVVNMDAEGFAVKRVKANKKMADSAVGLIPASMTVAPLLAQYDATEYGYCIDDGVDYTCYWYSPADVDYQDYSWDPYDPTY